MKLKLPLRMASTRGKAKVRLLLWCLLAGLLFVPGLRAESFPNPSTSAGKGIRAIPVSGQVTETDGTPIPGVSILESGTNNGTNTDVDGRFTLNVTGASAVLVFSAIGYVTQEVTVGTLSTINVKLASDTKALDEVVVVGYGTQKRANVTGAVATVNIDDKITSRALTNVSSGLVGPGTGPGRDAIHGHGGPQWGRTHYPGPGYGQQRQSAGGRGRHARCGHQPA